MLAVFAGLSPAAAHHGPLVADSASADPSPTPAVSFSATETTAVLTQKSAELWTTSIVVDVSPACLHGLHYELVTTWPDDRVPGKVAKVIGLGPGVPGRKAGQPDCADPAALTSAWGSEVDLHFRMVFAAVPRGAAVVLEDPDGIAVLPAITLTIHRQVTLTDYLVIPVGCGVVLAVLFLAAVIMIVIWDDIRDQRRPGPRLEQPRMDLSRNGRSFWKRFWQQPLFASAAWTFKDSWATNVTVGVSATGAILAAFGTVSTLFPGVQLDRFAILMAGFGAIIAVAPLVFGIANALWPNSYLTLPDNSLARPPTGKPAILHAVAGASISLPEGTTHDGSDPSTKAVTASVLPTSTESAPLMEIRGGWIALTRDGTIALAGGGTVVVKTLPAEVSITVGPAGAVVKVTGVADLTLPPDTEVITPANAAPDLPGTTPRVIRLRRKSILKVPSAGNVMNADMRSVAPAAVFTMFGIGAELGLLGVLAWFLSTESTAVRVSALVVLVLAALIVLGYAWSTTRSLADAGQGSALSASSTSFVY